MQSHGVISDAGNAYDLLTDVIAAIREEPRRYNQGQWALTTATEILELWNRNGRYIYDDDIRKRLPTQVPACGTVGCRAGWLVFLADGHFPTGQFSKEIRTRAFTVLGVPNIALDAVNGASENCACQDCTRMRVENLSKEDQAFIVDTDTLFDANQVNSDLGIGTPEYAEAGIAGLETYMATWETRLRATPITRTPDVESPHI